MLFRSGEAGGSVGAFSGFVGGGDKVEEGGEVGGCAGEDGVLVVAKLEGFFDGGGR